MTNKIISLLVVIVIILSVVAYQLWSADTEQTVPPQDAHPEPQLPAVENKNAEPEKSQPTLSNVEPEDEPSSEVGDIVEDDEKSDEKLCQLIDQYDDWYPKGESYESERFMSEVKAWAFSRGYFETEYSQGNLGIKKQSDYDYYEIDDLEEMAKAGDSMANVRLAYRLYLKGDEENMARAQPYCDRAIADGYTALVMCKSSYVTTQIYQEKQKEGDESDPERLKALELEYLAWQQASERLGDELGSKLTENMLSEVDNEFEQEQIAQKTQLLLEQVELQRQQFGIGERKHPPIPELLTYVLGKKTNPLDAFKSCFEE